VFRVLLNEGKVQLFWSFGRHRVLVRKHLGWTEVGGQQVHTKCDGNDMQMCGGIDATNVFVMFDCTEATEEERAAETASQNAELISSYGSFTEQTCGGAEDNNAEVNREETLIGSVDDCKLACWQGSGAETCHGFTYDEDQTRCSFHKDVLDGPVEQKVRTTCYFKMG